MKTEVPEVVQIQLLKPFSRVVRPDFSIADVHTLSVKELNEHDKLKPVGLLIFDVDNTLEDYLSPELLPETIDLFQRLRSAGYRLAIASNCDTERGKELKDLFANLADVVATPQDARDRGARWGKKPTTEMYDYIMETLKENGTTFTTAQTVMVGDQLLKDILFGKRSHAKTILTEKFGEHDHPSVEKYQRDVERKLLLAMGVRAVEGIPEFPERLTPFKQWVATESGLIVPSRLEQTKE